MFFGLTSPCTSATRVRLRRPRPARSSAGARSGWRARRRQQVGLEPDVEEDRVGGELRRELRAAPPSSAWMRASTRRPRAPSPGRHGRRAAPASTARWSDGAQVAHHEHAEARMLAEHLRRAARQRRVAPPASSAPRSRLRSIGARQSAATRSLDSARLAHTGPRAVSMRQMSDDTPPVERRGRAAVSAPARPELAQGLRELGGSADRRRRTRPLAALSHGACRFDQLDERVQRLVDRRRDAELAAAPRDEAVQVVDLARLAARHVLRGRRKLRRHRHGDAFHRLERRARSGRFDAVGRGHRHHLGTTACCSSRIDGSAASCAVRRLREAGDGVVGAVHHQLRPQLGHHVGRDAHRHLRGREQVDQVLQPRAQRGVARRRRRRSGADRPGRRGRSA